MYQRLTLALEDMAKRFGGLPSPMEAEHIWRDIWREEAHHSTAIEGNTLLQRDVDQLLEEGLTGRKVKQLSEYLEVRGYANAADWVYRTGIDPAGDWSTGELLSLNDVRLVHHEVLDLVWQVSPHPHATREEAPGSFRRHEIREFTGGMKPPSWTVVPAEVDQWLADVNTLRDAGPEQVERIAELHARFERIHPFLDGNGRTGRLLLNLVLVRLGMPPAIVYARDRDRYLRALRSSDAGEHGALGELIARAVLHNLNRLMLPQLAGPSRLVPIAALATAELSVGALRSAASRGALRAQRDPLGQWHSTQRFVDEYLAQRGTRRGRPRQS
ncbi:Fic family protein [Kineococcus gypseus]